MKITVEELSSTSKKVHVVFSTEDTEPLLKKTMRSIKKSVQIPGFRPGKAPDSIIVNRFRDNIEEDLIQEIMQESLKQADEEHDLDLITHPHLDAQSVEADWSGEITIHLDVYPTIEVPELDGIEIPELKAEVTEEQVTESLEELRESRAQLSPVEGTCEESHLCVADLFRTVEDGEEESIGKRLLSPTGDDPVPELTGAKPEDEITFVKDHPEDSLEEIAGKRVSYRAVVQEVKERILPDLNDAFATEVLGEETTVDLLKEKIRENLLTHQENSNKFEKKKQVIDQLLARVSIEVPEMLLNDEINKSLRTALNTLIQQGTPPDKVNIEGMKKELEPGAIRQLQEEILFRKMAAKWEIRVDDTEVVKAIKKESGSAPSDLPALLKKLKKDGQYESIRYHLTLEQVYERLIKQLGEENNADTDRS